MKAICPIARNDFLGDTLANASYGAFNEGMGRIQIQWTTSLNGRSPVYRMRLQVLSGNPVDPIFTVQSRRNVDNFFDEFQGTEHNVSPVGYQYTYDSTRSNQTVNGEPVTGDGQFYGQFGFRMQVQNLSNPNSPNGDGSFQGDTVESPRWNCAGPSNGSTPGQACKFQIPTLYRGYDPDGTLN